MGNDWGSQSIFNVELLPAREGDCILIEYGACDGPYRVLVDAGRKSTSRDISERLAGSKSVDLFVISHIDLDHIEGAVALLEEGCLEAKEVWFNAYHHVAGMQGQRGARHGEALSQLLRRNGIPWNERFEGNAAAIDGNGDLPLITMPGGLVLTVLSPSVAKLRRLEPRWVAECERAGIVPGASDGRSARAARQPIVGEVDIDALAASPFFPDDSPANGSSIALLAEFQGIRVLLAADAHEDALVSSLQRLRSSGPPLRLSLFKVAHHGSAGNLSKRLMDEIDCSRYAISSDGSRHGLPDPESIARIVKWSRRPSELYFNYRSPFTSIWESVARRSSIPFSVTYGKDGWLKIGLL